MLWLKPDLVKMILNLQNYHVEDTWLLLRHIGRVSDAPLPPRKLTLSLLQVYSKSHNQGTNAVHLPRNNPAQEDWKTIVNRPNQVDAGPLKAEHLTSVSLVLAQWKHVLLSPGGLFIWTPFLETMQEEFGLQVPAVRFLCNLPPVPIRARRVSVSCINHG